MLPFIDLKAQQDRIRPQIDAAIERVLNHGQYIMGAEIHEIEAQLCQFLGTKHCITLSSGTDALLAALMAYDVGPGDAILTTPFTFFATVETIALTGATPIFVDIEADTFNIDATQIEATLQQTRAAGHLNVRGILPVDLFGQACDYAAIRSIARQHDLFVIQDASQALGATYQGKRVPTQGDIGCTSFFPAKPLGCYGDGGACFTDDDTLAEKLRCIRVHGQGKDKYDNVRIGLNARFDTLQAAILIEKLKIYQDEIDRRQHVAQWYTTALTALNDSVAPPSLVTPTIAADRISVWAQYTLRSENRAQYQAALTQADIPSVIYYGKPMHLLDAMAYLGHIPGAFPVAEACAASVFSVPFHPYLDQPTVERIATVMRDAI